MYTQTILGLVPAVLCYTDGKVTGQEAATLHTASLNLLLTACALLVSAIIQSARSSVYYTLIVLKPYGQTCINNHPL